MKKITFLLFAAISFIGFTAGAQSVDEIVNKNIEAMGGREKLLKLKTVKMTGTVTSQVGDLPIVLTKSQSLGTRTDVDFNGTPYYQFANAKQGQIFMPGMPEAREMDEETLKIYVNQMDVQGPLLNYKAKGTSLELVGTEKVNAADAYNLKLTYSNGRVVNYFIDKATNRLIKTSGKQTMMGQETNAETTFSDYKQNTDGYWFPYTIVNARGTVTLEKIETNIAVDEKIYAN